MLTILRGSQASLSRFAQDLLARQPDALVVLPHDTRSGRVYRPANDGLRSIMAQLVSLLGDAEFESILARHRVAASFILDRLYSDLSSIERNEYRKLRADLGSNLSHNWFISEPLVSKWAQMLYDLLARRSFTLIAPDVLANSGTFAAVLRRLKMDFDVDHLHIILGFDRDDKRRAVESVDADGIRWCNPGDMGLFRSFVLFDGAILMDLEGEGAQDGDPADAVPVHYLDSQRDCLLYEQLGRREGVCQETMDTSCDVLESIFGSFDFTAALQFGLRILLNEHLLGAEQKALVYNTVAVAAHDRQFDSREGSASFNGFIKFHLDKALEHERDKTRRCVIGYRQGVTFARREKKPAEAIEIIDRRLIELFELPASRARAYQESWLLNIRAYAHMLGKNRDQAVRDVERAFRLSEEYWNGADDVTRDEIFSSQLFAGNRAALAFYENDIGNLHQWFERGTSLFEKHWEHDSRYVRYLTLVIARRELDFEKAIAAGKEGLDDALYARSAMYQDLYSVNLAELYYRAGQPGLAKEYAAQALKLYARVEETNRPVPVTLLLAVSEVRLRNYETAEKLYLQVEPKFSASQAARADLLSARAVLAARQGDAARCEELMSDAIGSAISTGERDAMLLVARRIGDAFLLLGQREQATDAFRRALEIADAMPPEGGGEPTASEMARVWLGLYEFERAEDYFDRMLAKLPRALEEDGDFWWELPRVLSLMTAEMVGRLESSSSEELLFLLKAAGQRADCSEHVDRLSTGMPPQPLWLNEMAAVE